MNLAHSAFPQLLHVRTRDELFAEMVRFAHSLDFAHIGLMTVEDQAGRAPLFENLTTVPSSGYDLYDDPELQRADPVMQHSKVSAAPMVWSQQTYVDAGCGPMWEQQAQFGLGAGVLWALHLPRGRHVVVGLDRQTRLSPAQVAQVTPALQLFTILASDIALELLPTTVSPATRAASPLPAHETEALKWVSNGATAEQVGHRLGLSVDSVRSSIRSAMQKLECLHPRQASLKALRLGLIS